MGQSLCQIHIHLVFGTRDRRPYLDEAIRAELWPYAAAVLRHFGCNVHAVGGMPDHVHICLDLTATRTAAEIASKLKANTSRWIHQRYPALHDFAWQRGYGAFSVSDSMLPKVRTYIEQQERHHAKRDFAEEFRLLCVKNGVAFDRERDLV